MLSRKDLSLLVVVFLFHSIIVDVFLIIFLLFDFIYSSVAHDIHLLVQSTWGCYLGCSFRVPPQHRCPPQTTVILHAIIRVLDSLKILLDHTFIVSLKEDVHEARFDSSHCRMDRGLVITNLLGCLELYLFALYFLFANNKHVPYKVVDDFVGLLCCTLARIIYQKVIIHPLI